MTNIFILPADVFLYILQYLDMHTRIAFALTCRRFRQICVDAKVFRKMDFSRCLVSTMQRSAINSIFRDRQIAQHVTELNICNLHVLQWQVDDQLEEFISICPELEALHIMNCGMGLQRLCRILNQAPKLTSLSWSLLDFTSEDLEFLMNRVKSFEGICLQNIRYLRLEMNKSKSHIQISKSLLSHFRDLEELEIIFWWMDKPHIHGQSFPCAANPAIPDFPESSDENELQHLHSLMMVAVRCPGFTGYDDTYKQMLSDFVLSVVRRKSSSTKWKKLWILQFMIGSTIVHPIDLPFLLHEVHPDDFQSVEEIALEASSSATAVDEMKTLFERIGDNSVRSLHLHLPDYRNSVVEFFDPISRVGGHSLKFLSLSVINLNEISAEQNMSIHSLFSNCMNITELDLLDCCFEKDICEPLSELKHLTKVQLMQCAVSSKRNVINKVEISKANLLTFVENCKNITHLDVRGCVYNWHKQFYCHLTDNDLLALSKLTNLESLTLYKITGIREWAFLKIMSEHCKFLTTLRIAASDNYQFDDRHVPILMQSAKFLKHLAVNVKVLVLRTNVFWNLLSHAKNLQRLCVKGRDFEELKFPLVTQTLQSLPQLHVLHLHSCTFFQRDVGRFQDRMIRMLRKEESYRRFCFEIITGNRLNDLGNILISNQALPLNRVELCDMTPVLNIPRS